MFWWCTKCKTWCINDPRDPHISQHKQQVVGVREDIVINYMERMVWELKVMDRLTFLK